MEWLADQAELNRESLHRMLSLNAVAFEVTRNPRMKEDTKSIKVNGLFIKLRSITQSSTDSTVKRAFKLVMDCMMIIAVSDF